MIHALDLLADPNSGVQSLLVLLWHQENPGRMWLLLGDACLFISI